MSAEIESKSNSRRLRDTPARGPNLFDRPVLNEALFAVPPGPLFHYTTQDGLLGIINKKEIWATHTQYLNDQREFHQALEVFREQRSVLSAESLGSRQQEILNALSWAER